MFEKNKERKLPGVKELKKLKLSCVKCSNRAVSLFHGESFCRACYKKVQKERRTERSSELYWKRQERIKKEGEKPKRLNLKNKKCFIKNQKGV